MIFCLDREMSNIFFSYFETVYIKVLLNSKMFTVYWAGWSQRQVAKHDEKLDLISSFFCSFVMCHIFCPTSLNTFWNYTWKSKGNNSDSCSKAWFAVNCNLAACIEQLQCLLYDIFTLNLLFINCCQ